MSPLHAHSPCTPTRRAPPSRPPPSAARATAVLTSALVVAAALAACPAAQVKSGGGGDVKVVLRRIDVVEADYEKMRLNVIVAIENATSSDVQATAEASVALVGEAPSDGAADDAADDAEDADDAEGEDSAEGEEGEESAGLDEEPAAPTGGSTPIDGARHAGTGAGSAVAMNTSELPISVEVPLPSDPALLEQILAWPKVLVHVEGNVKVGLENIRLGGHREIAPPHLPQVKLKEAQVASVDGGTAGTGFFTLQLDNKNPFPVTVDRMTWSVQIAGKVIEPTSGVREVSKDSVPASAVGEYATEVQINEAAFGKELKTILKNPTVPYVIEGTIEVRGIQKSFRFAGDMKFAR